MERQSNRRGNHGENRTRSIENSNSVKEDSHQRIPQHELVWEVPVSTTNHAAGPRTNWQSTVKNIHEEWDSPGKRQRQLAVLNRQEHQSVAHMDTGCTKLKVKALDLQ